MPETFSNSHIRACARTALAVNKLRIKTCYLTFLTATTTLLLAVLARIADTLPAPDKPEIQARNALRDRGISDPEELLQYAPAGRILAACQRYDAQRANGRKLSAGWLVTVVRKGGVDEKDDDEQGPIDNRAALHRRFEQLTKAFEPGTATESHMRMQARRWPDENPCPGRLVVTARDYPTLTVRCDECGVESGYPLRALAGLPKPSDPEKKPGLTLGGMGTPLLTAPIADPPKPSVTPAVEFELAESPFAETPLSSEQAAVEVVTFLAMFAEAVEAMGDDQEAWAYSKMKISYLRLVAAPDADPGVFPAGMWGAMRWAAAVLSPPSPERHSRRLDSRRPDDLRRPEVPDLTPHSTKEEHVVSNNHA